MTQKIEVESWEAFEAKVAELDKKQRETRGLQPDLLFRGQADSAWSLTTTLQRKMENCHIQTMSFRKYYRAVYILQNELQAFTEREWPLPGWNKVDKWSMEYDFSHCQPALWTTIYSYFSYLRHHGFPSPLLDWSRSQYIAAYFAFSAKTPADRVSIYVLSKAKRGLGSSNKPCVIDFGPNVKTHRRHFIQQSEYTMCMVYKTDTNPNEWYFADHELPFAREETLNGEPLNFSVHKFDIPASERTKVLKMLNKHNINAFTLFGSEESLMQTLAMREFDFGAM